MHKRFVVLQHRVFKIDGDHCVESHMNATIQDRCISGKMAVNCHVVVSCLVTASNIDCKLTCIFFMK